MFFMRSKHSPSARLLCFAFPFTSAAFAVGCASYLIATHGQTFEAFDDNTDALAQSRLAQAFNPHGNRTLSDIYVARVPLERIDAGLLSGDCNGSSSLVERYAAGLLGGWAYAIQRQISSRKAVGGIEANPDQLYNKTQIDQSHFNEGTSICDELVVIQKTPTSILFRGGSPSDGNGLREVDVLL
ncbi:hypothetical protein Q7P37_004616 [Cladosporium fusiforme]